MKSLKNKVFLTLFIIFTVFIVTILLIFNYQDYSRAKDDIINSLKRLNGEKEAPKFNGDSKPPFEEKRLQRFVDATIYTITLDGNKIDEIISHTPEGIVSNDINEIAANILESNSKNTTHIGNLYSEKYSYKLETGKYIVLIDNSDTNAKLLNSLKISVVIFVLSEILVYFISIVLSKWLIKPAEESFSKQKEFIADASHELKTPLSVIMASAEALENDNNQKWLNNIKSEADRMNKLIKDLLDLAKLDNDNAKNIYENINLSKVTEKLILTLESLMFEKDIKLEYNLKDDIYLNCNPEEIKQLLTILLDNAIKHSTDKGKIIVNLLKTNDKIILEVKNKGLPIPKGEEENIFERFYRVDKSRNRNENRYGLGLAIAKGIVLKHNGSITASSENEYTTFKIIFKVK